MKTTTMTERSLLTNEILRDAGLYREWLAVRYGCVFTYGAMGATYSHAYRHARRLAKLAGLSVTEVMQAAREDYLAMDDSE